MKNFFLFLIVLSAHISFAQNNATHATGQQSDSSQINTAHPIENEQRPFTIVEVMPKYPGGQEAMTKFIGDNIKYPKSERKKGISGTCYVTFVVETDGAVSGVKVLRGVPRGPLCDAEAVRVVSMMPAWTPGTQSGRKVRVQFNLPIKFTLTQR